ncbi:PLDc N-terminal domain-containing protein [Flavobacterium sp. NRK F10]|uniref:PLDc N-terminal domain-containing protein n=1 Tax=Flavobacterium sp. NRK F10 TaxID=2954931 RepID=UPI002090EB8E|nr:PLDc N-terminal domain-containing protein [Flavobacterium sp. NRK F10]MCO6175207.1 PLDc N-terminal domain-containing protein [Flavobacterium sp. NRK F10]
MELIIYLGIINPSDIVVGSIVYLLTTITALVLVLKNEKSTFIFFWILLLLFLPFLGSVFYILKYFINKKVLQNKPS